MAGRKFDKLSGTIYKDRSKTKTEGLTGVSVDTMNEAAGAKSLQDQYDAEMDEEKKKKIKQRAHFLGQKID